MTGSFRPRFQIGKTQRRESVKPSVERHIGMMEKEYPGERGEAMLWICLSVLCIALALAAAVLGFFPANAYMPELQPWSLEYYIIIIGLVFCGLCFKKIAYMRGTSVRIMPGHIIMTTWLGRSYEFLAQPPLIIDRRMRLILVPLVNLTITIPIPVKHIYRVQLDGKEVYINLESFSNQDSEIRVIKHVVRNGM